MINILIRGEDNLYKKGMYFLLKELFYQQWETDITLSGDFTAESIRNADIIIIGLAPGEYMTCIQGLRYRQQGIIIGLVDTLPKQPCPLPECYQDMVYVTRSASLAEVRTVITKRWSAHRHSLLPSETSPCYRCRPAILSQQQARVMALMLKGATMIGIANEMGISDKTVFAHKYMVMRRFNLRSDYELHAFLGNLAAKNVTHDDFHDYLALAGQ
jgi:Response regulator containing a CheY-like receiver domain and an HTH DNA-binding domain